MCSALLKMNIWLHSSHVHSPKPGSVAAWSGISYIGFVVVLLCVIHLPATKQKRKYFENSYRSIYFPINVIIFDYFYSQMWVKCFVYIVEPWPPVNVAGEIDILLFNAKIYPNLAGGQCSFLTLVPWPPSSPDFSTADYTNNSSPDLLRLMMTQQLMLG